MIPEVVASVIVLDELLSDGRRLSIEDLDLIALQENGLIREHLLSVLSAAVVLGDGRGRQVLRAFARLQPPDGSSVHAWILALGEARHYAHALPEDTHRLLVKGVQLGDGTLRSEPRLLAAIAAVAGEYMVHSLAGSLPMLLSAAAVETELAEAVVGGPDEVLKAALQSAPSYGGASMTKRAVDVLAVTRSWLAENSADPRRERVSLRVALRLVRVSYEALGAAPEHAMSVSIGSVIAPVSAEHRAAIKAAAEFASELIATSAPVTLDELGDQFVEILRAEPDSSTDPRVAAMLRSPYSVLRSAIGTRWEHLPVVARLMLMQVDASRQIAARARADHHLQRIALVHGVQASRSRKTGEDLTQRALDLGRELGPRRASALIHEARDAAPARTAWLAPLILRGAGLGTSQQEAIATIASMRSDPALRHALGHFIAGAIDGPGVPMGTLVELAADPEAASSVVAALDRLKLADERELIDRLVDAPAAHFALVDHLWLCRRIDEPDRAEILLRVGDAATDGLLPHIIGRFGCGGTGMGIPKSLRPQFVNQMVRAAGNDDIGEEVSDAFELLVQGGDDAWLEPIEARLSGVTTRFLSLLPRGFERGVATLTDAQRDRAIPRIAGWLEMEGESQLALGLLHLLPTVGLGRPALTERLVTWYVASERTRDKAIGCLSVLCDHGVIGPALRVLFDAGGPGDEDRLIAAMWMPAVAWAGSLEETYAGRAALFDGLPRRGASTRYRAFLSKCSEHFRALAEAQRMKERKLQEGYER